MFRAGAAGESTAWAVVDWYARDRYARAGWFEAVGQPIPRATFRDLDAYMAVRDAVEALPRVTDATVHLDSPAA